MAKSSLARIEKRIAKLAIRDNRNNARRAINKPTLESQYILKCNQCDYVIMSLVMGDGILPRQTDCFNMLFCNGFMDVLLCLEPIEQQVPQLIWSVPDWTDYLYASEGIKKFIKRGGLMLKLPSKEY